MNGIRADLDRAMLTLELMTAREVYYTTSEFIPKGKMLRIGADALLTPFPVWNFNPADMPALAELLGDKLFDFREWKQQEATR